jgi:tetratricopeptide (TPR) repeat protein
MSAGLIAGAVLLSLGADPAGISGGLTPPGSLGVLEARKDALARYGVAIWQVRRERLLSAAKSLEEAAKQDPDSTAPLKELVRIYAQVGREPEAIRAARQVLARDPTDADTAHTLARLLHDAGELADALDAAKLAAESPALADRPDKALAVYRDLATLFDATGDPAGAADTLRKAVDLLTEDRAAVLASGAFAPKEIDAEAADSWERLGRALVKAGKSDAAAQAFRAAHALYADPKKVNNPAAAARLDWNLSGVYASAGEPAKALTHLEAFLKLRPEAIEPYERLASVLRQAGRAGDVVPALRGHADRDPKNLPLRAVLASELARDPDTRRQADAAFAELLAATNDPKLVRAVVRSHIETGRPGRVVADLDQAYQAAKGDDAAGATARELAAGTARAIADALRTEPAWADEVLRAAAEDLRQGVKRAHPTWHAMAALAARHRKLELAAVQFRQVVRTAPRDTEYEAYSGLIGVLWRLRKPADVAAVCRDGLRSAHVTPPVFFNYHLALALAQLGEATEAIAAADKAILQAGAGFRLGARLRKVWVLRALGRYEDAAAVGRKLLDEFDAPADRLEIRYTLAGALWGAKRYAEAERELRAILDADPDHAGACNALGYYLADQGRDLDEAERLIRHAVAVDRADRRRAADPEPDNAAYLDSLGWVLFRRGKLAEARDWLEKAAALPDGAIDPTVWDHLGDVCFRLGDKAKAKAHWEQALTLYESDPRGKEDGRPEEVRRKLKRVP